MTRDERASLIFKKYDADIVHVLLRLQRLEDLQKAVRKGIAEGFSYDQRVLEASSRVDWSPEDDL